MASGHKSFLSAPVYRELVFRCEEFRSWTTWCHCSCLLGNSHQLLSCPVFLFGVKLETSLQVAEYESLSNIKALTPMDQRLKLTSNLYSFVGL
jgi:hypothetical protein